MDGCKIRRWACGSLAMAVLLSLAGSREGRAQAPEDPAHAELRALRDEAVAAFQKRDIDRLVACLRPNIVLVPQNAEVIKGHDGVRAFHKRMSEGDSKTVQSQKTEFSVDELSILYGDDTAIAYGTLNDQFTLSNGMEFALTSKWTATMVKADGKWLVASFSASANMFDNGVSNLMLKWNTFKSGGAGLAIGALAVGGIAFFMRRRA